MTDEMTNTSWGRRNRKWLIPLAVIMVIAGAGISLLSGTSDMAKAYADEALFKEAVAKASDNTEVSQSLGSPEPLSKMAIAEGNTVYNAEGTLINATITIKGEKGKGKLDFSARKKSGGWKFDKIQVRMKDPDKTIPVLP